MLSFVIRTRCETPYIFEGLTLDPTNTNRDKTNSIRVTQIDRKDRQRKDRQKKEDRAASVGNTTFLFPAREREEKSREKREPHEKEREEKDREREEKSREKRRDLRDGNGEKITTD